VQLDLTRDAPVDDNSFTAQLAEIGFARAGDW